MPKLPMVKIKGKSFVFTDEKESLLTFWHNCQRLGECQNAAAVGKIARELLAAAANVFALEVARPQRAKNTGPDSFKSGYGENSA